MTSQEVLALIARSKTANVDEDISKFIKVKKRPKAVSSEVQVFSCCGKSKKALNKQNESNKERLGTG